MQAISRHVHLRFQKIALPPCIGRPGGIALRSARHQRRGRCLGSCFSSTLCPATDPGWTPLFITAGGLVMEISGMVTHGSVVAREYGMPAVVGVHAATTRLQTGQRVRVDGNRGRVTVLET